MKECRIWARVPVTLVGLMFEKAVRKLVGREIFHLIFFRILIFYNGLYFFLK